MKIKFKKFIKTIIEIIKKPAMSFLPGQLAFSFVLTIIPAFLLLNIIAALFSISLDSIIGFINDYFPNAVSSLLLPLISGKGFDLSMVTYLIAAFWLASTGAYAVITASDMIYEIQPGNQISKRIKSFIMTFMLLALILFMVIVPAFGDMILNVLIKLISNSNFVNEITIIYYLLKYPLSFILIYFNIKLLYTIAPKKEIKSKYVTKGALFTTLVWMIATQIYSFWVTNVTHYDLIYGSISNVIILLIWFYILAYIFVIGLSINASIEKEKK